MLLADGRSFGVRSGLLKARALNFLRDEGVGGIIPGYKSWAAC